MRKTRDSYRFSNMKLEMMDSTNTTDSFSRRNAKMTAMSVFAVSAVLFGGYAAAFFLLGPMLYPSDVILGSIDNLGKGLALTPALIPCVLLGIIITQSVILKWRLFRKTAETKRFLFLSHSMLRRFIAIQLVFCFVLGVMGISNFTCVTESGIVHRTILLQTFRYSWNDVRTIESLLRLNTTKSTKYITLEYTFQLSSGISFSLDSYIEDLISVYPRLIRVIKSHPEITLNSNLSVPKEKVYTLLSRQKADMAYKMIYFMIP
jgi:hypothetical protein